jgi:hypothetical protein
MLLLTPFSTHLSFRWTLFKWLSTESIFGLYILKVKPISYAASLLTIVRPD